MLCFTVVSCRPLALIDVSAIGHGPGVSKRACACEAAGSIGTDSSTNAAVDACRALVVVARIAVPFVVGVAETRVRAVKVEALGVGVTTAVASLAFVYVRTLGAGAHKARVAGTGEAAGRIGAGGKAVAVVCGPVTALVVVACGTAADPATVADAGKAAVLVGACRLTMTAVRVGGALVDVVALDAGAGPPCSAHAREAAGVVGAATAKQSAVVRARGALISVDTRRAAVDVADGTQAQRAAAVLVAGGSCAACFRFADRADATDQQGSKQ